MHKMKGPTALALFMFAVIITALFLDIFIISKLDTSKPFGCRVSKESNLYYPIELDSIEMETRNIIHFDDGFSIEKVHCRNK